LKKFAQLSANLVSSAAFSADLPNKSFMHRVDEIDIYSNATALAHKSIVKCIKVWKTCKKI
jgi:hypothetical protein